jgi:hypothetical protein
MLKPSLMRIQNLSPSFVLLFVFCCFLFFESYDARNAETAVKQVPKKPLLRFPAETAVRQVWGPTSLTSMQRARQCRKVGFFGLRKVP